MPILNFGQPDGGIIQTAFITDDICNSMTQMTEQLNVGPWFFFEDFPLVDPVYRGEKADFRVSLALGNSGHNQIELIQMLDDRPSPYRETLDARGWGFHHHAIAATDYESRCRGLEEQGFEEVMSCRVEVGARAAYFDTGDSVFGMIEVVEVTTAVEALWTMIYQASVGWSGDDPVRTPG
ncbi:MAG: VOC family protein [Chromatocurvus sp.]